MVNRKKVNVQYRRKREGRTNYYKRLKLLKSRTPRLVIRKSLKYLLLQLVEYQAAGDKVIISYNTKSLEKMGWKYSKKNLSAAYLGGLIMGKLALSKKVKEAILDAGLHTNVKGSKIYAAVKGVNDGGLVIPCGKEMYPSEDRLSGKHILTHFNKIKGQNTFQYSKLKHTSFENMPVEFNAIKEKIIKGNIPPQDKSTQK
ncbi:50S ribosomal protein L18 [Candidatus Woesearchaeota archaeon]|nr:50S ribosomal protein L18P [uncultured archaeon]MBS3122720.1 50S ribosomal protein L18 [Candidatus Woesearchaeota archaeon]